MISAYAQACRQDTLQIWVGIFGVPNPAAPELTVQGTQATVRVLQALAPIRDHMRGADGGPLNHRSVLQLTGLQPGTPYRVIVSAGGESMLLDTRTLPTEVPAALDDTFNVLLFSCYSQAEDASMLVGTLVGRIATPLHLTLMMGDQIYGDLPLFHDLGENAETMARTLGAKYRSNWISSALGPGGLGQVLARAPVMCVADDHEYWNNFPFHQAQLPETWTPSGREQWRRAAQGLYEDYQLAGPAGAVQRVDVAPLKILTIDMRSFRDDQFGQLITQSALRQLKAWADDLRAARHQGQPAYGMLCSGQALFVSPAGYWQRVKFDAEMANYAQFENQILPILDDLALAGIPVIYVTGDVHWGRVAQAVDVRNQAPMLYEVITSPSALVRAPLVDRVKELEAGFGGMFAAPDPWPRHGAPDPVPERLGKAGHFRLLCDPGRQSGLMQRGNQVAVLSFARAGPRLDFKADYFPISSDKALAQPRSTRTFQLHNY